MPSKYDPCKKSCCWNPSGTCSRNRTCRCHVAYNPFDNGGDLPAPAPATNGRPVNVIPLFQEPA